MRNKHCNEEFTNIIQMVEKNHPDWSPARVSEEVVDIVQAQEDDNKCTFFETLKALIIERLMTIFHQHKK